MTGSLSFLNTFMQGKKKLLNGWTMQWNNMRNNAYVFAVQQSRYNMKSFHY